MEANPEEVAAMQAQGCTKDIFAGTLVQQLAVELGERVIRGQAAMRARLHPLGFRVAAHDPIVKCTSRQSSTRFFEGRAASSATLSQKRDPGKTRLRDFFACSSFHFAHFAASFGQGILAWRPRGESAPGCLLPSPYCPEMSSHFPWDETIEDFLLGEEALCLDDEHELGDAEADEESAEARAERMARLRAIRQRALELRDRYRGELEERLEICSDLADKQTKVTSTLSQIDEAQISGKIAKFMSLQMKIQLMVLAKALGELEACSDVEQIPDIVLRVQAAAPPAIFRTMHIYRVVRETTVQACAALLKRFLQALEEHLSEENRSWSVSSHPSGEGESWAVFLKQARSWLLAYTMVSILASSLMDSKQAVMEGFQSAMDEAFTPLWGRFFHHLKLGREAQSTEQVFWTFSFARSFLQMLLGLCAHITATDKLRALCDLDYARAGRDQIMDKALRFLRAHLAQVLVEQDALGEDLSSRLFEDVLELDEWLAQFSAPLTLCAVLYDAKAWFHRILWAEQRFVVSTLSSHCTSTTEAFVDMFGGEGSLLCYKAVYHCVSIVQSCRHRYSFFPRSAQYLFSEVVLEPVLCMGLGLLLYRIRSDPVLFAVASGRYKQTGDEGLCQTHVQTFARSVDYFQTALANAGREGRRDEGGSEENQTAPLAASSTRCKRRWSIVQSWMPKILITETQSRQGFSLADLARTALKTSDRFRSPTFDYRVQEQTVAEEGQTLDDCILIVRGLALTLVDVLDKQRK